MDLGPIIAVTATILFFAGAVWIIYFRQRQGKVIEKYAKQKGLAYSKKDIYGIREKLLNFEPKTTEIELDTIDTGREYDKFKFFNGLKHFIKYGDIYLFTGWRSDTLDAYVQNHTLHPMVFFETKNSAELIFMTFKWRGAYKYIHTNTLGSIPWGAKRKDDSEELSQNPLFTVIKEIIESSWPKGDISFCLRQGKVLIAVNDMAEGVIHQVDVNVNNERIDALLNVSEKIQEALRA